MASASFARASCLAAMRSSASIGLCAEALSPFLPPRPAVLLALSDPLPSRISFNACSAADRASRADATISAATSPAIAVSPPARSTIASHATSLGADSYIGLPSLSTAMRDKALSPACISPAFSLTLPSADESIPSKAPSLSELVGVFESLRETGFPTCVFGCRLLLFIQATLPCCNSLDILFPLFS